MEAAEAVTLALASPAEVGVWECAEVTLGDVLAAGRLRRGHAELGFFDSVHAAVAEGREIPPSCRPAGSARGVPHPDLGDL